MDSEVGGEDENEIDFSIIRSAIRLRGRMIDQIFSGVHYGSPEVRNLLLNECDIILECKVCRNLFRSLPNLVAHKRVYCNQEYTNYKSSLETVENSNEILVVDPCDSDDVNSATLGVANSVVDQLIEGSFEGKSHAYKFYTKAAEKVELNREQSTSSLQFTTIDSNPNAVEQQVIQKGEIKENISEASAESRTMGRRQKKPAVKKESSLVSRDKTDVNQAVVRKKPPQMNLRKRTQDISKKDTTPSTSKSLVGKQTKVPANKESNKAKHLENLKDLKKPIPLTNDQVDLANKQCLACKEKYTSVRSLRAHIDRMHGKCTKFSFPCPQCDSKFKYLWNVVRHLLLVHKKTKAQVDKMRPKLKKSVVKENSSFEKKTKTNPPEITKEEKKKKKTGKSDEDITKKEKNSPKVQAKGPRKFKIMVDELDKLKAQTESSQFKSGGHIHLCDFCQDSFWKKSNLQSHLKTCLKNPNALPTENEPGVKRKPENDDEPAEEATPIKKVKSEDTEANNTRDCGLQQEEEQSIVQIADEREEGQMAELQNIHQKLTKAMKQQRRERLERIEAPLSIEGDAKKDDVYDFVEEDLSVNTVLTDEQKHELGLLDQEDSLPSVRLVEEIWVDKEPGKPLQKVKSGRAYVLEERRTSKSSCQDQKKIQHIIDEDKLICLKCNQSQTSISNLRRHAVRHLGWKRYECKCCTFTSYNRSEINRHITKCHASQMKKYSLNELIVDLQEAGEKLRTQKKLQSISEKQFQGMYSPSDFVVTYPSKKSSSTTYYVCKPGDRKKPGISTENIQEPSLNKFNISTRNSPREFDLRPYQRVDKMETMCTRKGYYLKPNMLDPSGEENQEIESCEDKLDAVETTPNAVTTELVQKMMSDIGETAENNVAAEIEVTSNNTEEQSSKKLNTQSCEESKNDSRVKDDNRKALGKDEWVDVESYEPDEPHMTEANIFYDSGDEAIEHRDNVENDQGSCKVVEEKHLTNIRNENVSAGEMKCHNKHPMPSEENNSEAPKHLYTDQNAEDGNMNTTTEETLKVDTKPGNTQIQEYQSQETACQSNKEITQASSIESSETLPPCGSKSSDPCIKDPDANRPCDDIQAVPSVPVDSDATVTEKVEPSYTNNLLTVEETREQTRNMNRNDLPIAGAHHVISGQRVPPSNQLVLVSQSNSYVVQPTESDYQMSNNNAKTETSVDNSASQLTDQQSQQMTESVPVQDVNCYQMNQLQEQVVEDFSHQESAVVYSQSEAVAVVESETLQSHNMSESVAHSSEVDQQFIVDTSSIAGNNNESMFENNSSILVFEIPLSSAENLVSSAEVHDQQVVPENH